MSKVGVYSGMLNTTCCGHPAKSGRAWVYLYRTVDKQGDTIDFILSELHEEAAATAFFKQAINQNEFPGKAVMDQSGANYAGLANINLLLILAGFSVAGIEAAYMIRKEQLSENNIPAYKQFMALAV